MLIMCEMYRPTNYNGSLILRSLKDIVETKFFGKSFVLIKH